jgi:hypothetical protein
MLHWIKCHKFVDPASKQHLEAFVWSLSASTGAPSHMEGALSKCSRLEELNSLANAILEMMGNRIIMLPEEQ